MKLIVHTDGGSLNNPGQAAIGFHLDQGDTRLYEHSEAIGIASNNVAEYTALIRALTYIKNLLEQGKLDTDQIHIMADSELMIKQVTGLYKVKNADIKPLHTQIKILEMEIGIPIIFQHVLRDLNKDADALVKKALGR